MDPRLLQVVVVIVLWAKKMKQRGRKFYHDVHVCICVQLKQTSYKLFLLFLRIVILTVSIGVFSKGRVTPPGVRVGLKETERFPDTGVAVGTTSLCTGGSVASI